MIFKHTTILKNKFSKNYSAKESRLICNTIRKLHFDTLETFIYFDDAYSLYIF